MKLSWENDLVNKSTCYQSTGEELSLNPQNLCKKPSMAIHIPVTSEL